MDICHLKNAELEAKHLKYKGRVVLRGDIVKDDSGSYAVFTEQGSSASQMTAAKVMDIICRVPGCAGQATDAVSACTQVKKEDAPSLLKIPKSECPDIWIRLPRHKWPKSCMVQYRRSSCSSWTEPVRSSFGRTDMGKAILRKSYWSTVGRRFPIGNACSYTVKKGYYYLCVWMTLNWLETKYWSDVAITQQWKWFGRTNIFPRSCVPGVHSKTMWNKQRHCGQI